MSKFLLIIALAAITVGAFMLPAQKQSGRVATASSQPCPNNDDSGLTLPPGFRATIFADGIGHARHMVVAPNGVLYVNTWSGKYYGSDTPAVGGFLIALQDKRYRADVIERFGETAGSGGHAKNSPLKP
jgi:glucose/arabinose dehydrogenase